MDNEYPSVCLPVVWRTMLLGSQRFGLETVGQYVWSEETIVEICCMCAARIDLTDIASAGSDIFLNILGPGQLI